MLLTLATSPGTLQHLLRWECFSMSWNRKLVSWGHLARATWRLLLGACDMSSSTRVMYSSKLMLQRNGARKYCPGPQRRVNRRGRRLRNHRGPSARGSCQVELPPSIFAQGLPNHNLCEYRVYVTNTSATQLSGLLTPFRGRLQPK